MLVSFDQLNEFFEDTDEEIIQQYVQPLNDVMEFYEINNKQRIAMFLAQVGHESGGLTTIKENLNYSADRLKVIFPKYFKGVDPSGYARNPEKIANRVYANRMGNGPEESGDGWRYRGRGPIQLTGKANYTKFAQEMFDDWQNLVEHPDWVTEDKDFALMSAIWFWNSHNLNHYADIGDLKQMTKIINGGYLGLEERQNLYNTIIQYV